MAPSISRRDVAFYIGYSMLVGLAWSYGSVAVGATPLDMVLGVATTTAVISLAGVPCFLLVYHVAHASRHLQSRERVARAVLAMLVGAIVGGLCLTLIPLDTFPRVRYNGTIEWRFISTGISLYLVHAGLITVMLVNVQRAHEIEATRRAAEIATAHQLRSRNELRLRMLQTQIEPHFVVNVLANVKELDRRQPGSGRGLLRTLAEYLALAMSPERLSQATVRDELALTQKYLEILAVRMGTRLAVDIDVPDRLREAAIPPLVLGTLVENAIRHGIAPRESGGRVRIEYREEGSDLLIRVADDGIGFKGDGGSGIGLVNTRARLAALYGDRAKLELRGNPGGGVVALVRLPLEA